MLVSGAKMKVTWVKIALSFRKWRVTVPVSNAGRRVIKVDSAQTNLKSNKQAELASTVMKKAILGGIVPSLERHNQETSHDFAINAIRKGISQETAPNKTHQIIDRDKIRTTLIGTLEIMKLGGQTINSKQP